MCIWFLSLFLFNTYTHRVNRPQTYTIKITSHVQFLYVSSFKVCLDLGTSTCWTTGDPKLRFQNWLKPSTLLKIKQFVCDVHFTSFWVSLKTQFLSSHFGTSVGFFFSQANLSCKVIIFFNFTIGKSRRWVTALEELNF